MSQKTLLCTFLFLQLTAIIGYLFWDGRLQKNNKQYLQKNNKQYLKQTENILFRQHNRLGLIQNYCREEYQQSCTSKSCFEISPLALVEEKHHLLFCTIAKVGCSTWKYRLALASAGPQVSQKPIDVHSWKWLQKYGVKSIQSYNSTQKQHILDSYYKVMFVRHPLVRLVSAYREKFDMNFALPGQKPMFWKIGQKMVNFFRKDKNHYYNVSFTEFISFIVHSKSRHARNGHWRNFVDHCRPCQVKYDFVGTMETFSEDSLYIAKNIMKNPLLIDKNRTQHSTHSDYEIARSYFKRLNGTLKKKLYYHILPDLRLFGYKYDILDV